MTVNPDSIVAVRKLIQSQSTTPKLSNASLGIGGDDSHTKQATGYHQGKSSLKATAYSVVESARDRNGLSEAASALDIGNFTIKTKLGTFTNRSMTAWIVLRCKAGDPDTRDFREIIYSSDGKTVKRWDDLGIRSSGDDSHFGHDHFSWYRDSEKRDKTAIFRRWFILIGAIEGEDMTEDDFKKIGALITASETRIKADIAGRVDDWLSLPSGSKGNPTRSYGAGLNDAFDLRGVLVGDKPDTVAAKISPDSPLMRALADIARTANYLDDAHAAGVFDREPTVVTQEQVSEALLVAVRQVLREGVGE